MASGERPRAILREDLQSFRARVKAWQWLVDNEPGVVSFQAFSEAVELYETAKQEAQLEEQYRYEVARRAEEGR